MNVLIYEGNGTSTDSVQQAYTTLKSLLGHAYDIIKVNATTLNTEPWQESCSLLVIPGGRDTPYCKDLNSSKIKQYVQEGGRYLGFCAGAYFASQDIEFEKDTELQVIGPRDLGFYPGTSRGTMYPGFVYNSEKGARAVPVYSKQQNKSIKAYYNGGGYFVHPEQYDHVKVICTFEKKGLSDEKEPAAGVLCTVGKGSALLFGFHPEYDVRTVDLSENDQQEDIKKELTASLQDCRDLLSQSLSSIGLKVQQQIETTVPELTPLYLSTLSKELLQIITNKLLEEADKNGVFKDSNDCFHISAIDEVSSITEQLKQLSVERESQDKCPVLEIKYPQPSANGFQVPGDSYTPYFNLEKFYTALLERRKQEWGGGVWYRLGNAALCAEVITSTQTVLDKNYSFAQCLPDGLVCIGANQIAGRGRGRNSWVSQSGALQFSFIVRHSLSLTHAPVVFVQYITALAVVESIRTREGYEQVPLRVKWPNDIYVETDDGLKKVGGLIVNSSFVQDEFLLVVGCGVNLNNPHPTVSINDVIATCDAKLKKLEKEDVLAHFLVTFEKFYMEFCEKGMGAWFLDKYYNRWLHSDKLVTLTTHDDEKARIVGITSDYGLLEAVSVNDPRKKFQLQPDGNSFDMLKGLIKKKT